MDEIIYITTPIYYVNADPHIGHAYTTIAADTLARHYRLRGARVFFLTGSDEHGQKVAKAAADMNMSPEEYTSGMTEKYKKLWETLNITNDAFIRTTDPQHKETVSKFLMNLKEKGDIEKRSYTGWYCVPDERFWREKDLVDGNCPDCSRPVERIREENYFFLMSKYRDRLIEHIESNPGFIMPDMRRNEVLGFLKNNELDDLCISRPKSRFSWGITLPFDSEYVTYVWFDALTNYFSATRYLSPSAGEWWPAWCHIIGKDILTTHAVYWSTMLMAMDIKLPRRIFAHGWWTVEGKKMSKSLGNVVDPASAAGRWGVDAFRYFLLKQVSFGFDGDYSEELFRSRYDAELANELGNLLSRVITMIEKYGPEYSPGSPDGFDIIAEEIIKEQELLYERLAFSAVIEKMWELVRKANIYVEKNRPWELAVTDRAGLNRVLTNLYEVLILISDLIFPVMPSASRKMKEQLGRPDTSPGDPSWKFSGGFGSISKGNPLFPKKS